MSIKALYVLKYHNPPSETTNTKNKGCFVAPKGKCRDNKEMTFPTYHYNLTLAMVYFRIQSLAAVGSIRSRLHNQGSQSLFVGGGPVTTYYTVLLERSSADET